MIKILLKFNLFKKDMTDEPFLFWSCVLDSLIDNASVDYKLLNRKNEYKIEDCEPLWLRIEYLPQGLVNDVVSGYQKRPAYFVAQDKTFQTGSPYSDSASLVETYYQDTLEFVKRLSDFCGYDSDYKLNLLQRRAIKLIKKLIGIDIIKNESTGGALSIYNKLPAFHVGGNYNSSKGERYVTISAIDDLSDYENLSALIEITDNEKILFNAYMKFTMNFRYHLPNYLEDFSQLHITVFGEKKSLQNIISKIYEEKFHLFRSFNIDLSISGSYSKIVRNRYLERQTDKITVYDHVDNISNNPKDFFDIEQSYKSLVFGKEKEYLESRYFNNTSEGKVDFLEWIRKTIHSAKTIKIIDAYFDNYALNDFLSCCDARFQLTIVTTDPEKRLKSTDHITNTNNLSKNISVAFPGSKIYYAPKLHDRYLYVDDGRDQKLYSFSNSWNGTVNHYSIFIQEVPSETALRIYDEINTYIINDNLQILPSVIAQKESSSTQATVKYSEAYIKTLFDKLEYIAVDNDTDGIINIITELFFAIYYGKAKKYDVRCKVFECLENLEASRITNLIDTTSIKLLEEQKKSFDEENAYMDGEPFLLYKTPRQCIKRYSNISMWGETRSYRLSLNYGLAELLNVCFALNPEYTINSLSQHEERICVKKVSPTNDTPILKYRVSEYIIQSFLTDFYPLYGKIEEKTWRFIDKASSFIYIRLFFAMSIVHEALYRPDESNLVFDEIIALLVKLRLSQDEIAIVLGNALNSILLQKQPINNQQINPKIDYQESIIEYIVKNSCEKGIISFSMIAFIEPYDIRVNDLFSFLCALEQAGKKHETETIEKLFMLYALHTNPKLQNKARALLQIEQKTVTDYLAENEQISAEISDIDVRKFIPVLPDLGKIFAHNLENIPEDTGFNNIVFSLSTDCALIFNTKYPEKLTLFYYDLLFLLNTVFYLQNKNTGSRKILEFTGWYLPICIDCLPDDFYGLGLKIIGLYTELISEDKKEALLNRLTYSPMRALIASAIKKQSAETIKICENYAKQYDIDVYNKSIPVENFLSIGISLCMRCADECNSEIKRDIFRCITQINDKIKSNIANEVKPILDSGIVYANEPSAKNRAAFVDSMKDNFFPHQVVSLLDY